MGTSASLEEAGPSARGLGTRTCGNGPGGWARASTSARTMQATAAAPAAQCRILLKPHAGMADSFEANHGNFMLPPPASR